MLLAILLIIIPLAFSLISFVGGRKLAPILGLTGAMASLLYFLYLLSNYNVRHELMYNTSMMWIPEIKGIFHVELMVILSFHYYSRKLLFYSAFFILLANLNPSQVLIMD